MAAKSEYKINRKVESVKPQQPDQSASEHPSSDLSTSIHSLVSGDPRATSSARRDAVLRLQQTHGNQAVQRMLQRESSAVQRDPVAIASLGMAIFAAGQTVVSQGGFSCTSNTPSYQHPNPPATATWDDVVETLHMQAHHPRYGFGDQDFFFRLSYQRNGNDIRNAAVNALKDQSSTMLSSSFTINWGGQEHSNQSAPVSEIAFNISNSVWDPVGRGQASFWGQLVISADKATAPHTSFTVGSERDWVWAV